MLPILAFAILLGFSSPEAEPVTTVRIGETRMIAVPAGGIAALPSTIDLKAPVAAAFEIVGPALRSIPADRIFVRVRGITTGTSVLSVAGSNTVINVVTADSAAPPPACFAPSHGATFWGSIAVGVEATDAVGLAGVELEVTALGTKEPMILKSATLSAKGWGPLRTATFNLDADVIAADACTLVPVSVGADGSRTPGAAILLNVVRPTDAGLTVLEAETRYTVDRPKRFADTRLSVGMDDAASGKRFLANYSAEPAMCAPLVVESPGWYQVIGTFGGSSAAGTLPTVSLVVDGAQYGVTNTRIVREAWHRVPLGVPVLLEKGERVLTPYFETDFYVERLADRNLKIDRIELVRVRDGAASDVPSDDGGMMSGGSMTGGTMGGMTGGSGGAGNAVDDAWGQAAAPLRIAFETPINGQTVPGDVRISGRLWWPDIESPQAAAPVVSLFINGQEHSRQWSAAPIFEPDSGAWQQGRNTVQLVGRTADGAAASTPVQFVDWSGPVAPTETPHFVRFAPRDPAWTPASKGLLTKMECDERCAFRLNSPGSIEATLPDDLTGRFQILLQASGEAFEGPPIAKTALVVGETVTAIKDAEIPHWMDGHEAGEVTLEAGPKLLRITFLNDHLETGVGDRNLVVQSLALRRLPTAPDTTPPMVRVLYPAPNAAWEGFMADAVVIEAADDRTLVEAELIIDGVQTGLSRWMPREFGRIVLPIMGRTMEPGPHTIAVRVRDEAGNTTTSSDQTFERLPEASAQPTRYERAVHLLNRFAFGPSEADLADLLAEGEDRWLRTRLTASTEEPGDLAALGRGLAFYRNPRSEYEVKGRAVQQAIGTTNPVRMRFTFWAQNHFSTWVNKTEGERKWAEHVAFSRLGVASFPELLFASATGPAMLRYLDQDTSFAGGINENYAREIMELHTLGVNAGYSQADVTALAHLLTGWTSAQIGDGRSGGEIRLHSFRFDPALAEGRETELLGVTFPKAARADRFDRVRAALELLAAHPKAAEFVCGKLASHYTQSPANGVLVADLAKVFEATGGDMRDVLLALASHPLFFADRKPRMAHPLDYALRLIRVTKANNPWSAIDFLQRSGAGMFDRATPDGYPEDDADYADSNAMVQRWALAHDLRWPISNLAFPRLRWGNATEDAHWAQYVIDSTAIRLTGNVLGETSNTAMLTAAQATEGSPHDRCRAIAELVAQMPECNLK